MVCTRSAWFYQLSLDIVRADRITYYDGCWSRLGTWRREVNAGVSVYGNCFRIQSNNVGIQSESWEPRQRTNEEQSMKSAALAKD